MSFLPDTSTAMTPMLPKKTDKHTYHPLGRWKGQLGTCAKTTSPKLSEKMGILLGIDQNVAWPLRVSTTAPLLT